MFSEWTEVRENKAGGKKPHHTLQKMFKFARKLY